MKPYVLLFCCALLAGCVRDPAIRTDAVPFKEPRYPAVLASDIAYGSDPAQTMDIYTPGGDNPPPLRPAALFVHGGGFTGGDKAGATMPNLCRELAARGYVCVSINYRLANAAPQGAGDSVAWAQEAALADASFALDWLRQNAAQYKLDAGRIAVGGASAGSFTALRLTYAQGAPVRAVVDLWGTLGPQLESLGAGDPPLIILHGKGDPVIASSNAVDLADRAKATGVPYELLLVDVNDHGFNLARVENGRSVYQHIADFLYDHMALDKLNAAP